MSVKCILTNQLSKGELDGYLPLSGGTMSGSIDFNNEVLKLGENIFLLGAEGLVTLDVGGADSNARLQLDAGMNFLISGNAGAFKIYHQGYKPTPTDIGAVATDTPMTFSINESGGLTVTY